MEITAIAWLCLQYDGSRSFGNDSAICPVTATWHSVSTREAASVYAKMGCGVSTTVSDYLHSCMIRVICYLLSRGIICPVFEMIPKEAMDATEPAFKDRATPPATAMLHCACEMLLRAASAAR